MMSCEQLHIHERPVFINPPRLVMGFSGWMDGGDVSTGTIECLVKEPGTYKMGAIEARDFYIYSFPGSMEMSALFRPYVNIKDGLICEYEEPKNTFFANEEHDLILFSGKEPHLHWHDYVDCIFQVVEQFGVTHIYFVGSVAGLVPHTRDPRFSSVISEESLKPLLEEYHIKLTQYEGPCSIITHMTRVAAKKRIPMISLVAEIPAYVQGRNPRCIEAVARRLAHMLGISLNLEELRIVSEELEKKLDTLILEQRSELAEHIQKLEENYDKEVFDTEMGDLKSWLKQRGVRLD